MLRISFFLVTIVLLSGCASIETVSERPGPVSPPDKLVDTNQITTGMGYEKVKNILSKPIVIGYEIPENKEAKVKKFTIS